jgi:hypothetical protein
MKEKIIPYSKVPEQYKDHLLLSRHPIIRDEEGIYRYKKSSMMRWLCDHINLNIMWKEYEYGVFTREEFMQFYRDIGYSLCCFEEVWGNEMDKILGIKRDPETGEEISRKKYRVYPISIRDKRRLGYVK